MSFSRPIDKLMEGLRNTRLRWKLLIPFLVVILAIGSAGSFFLIRGMTQTARANLDQDLQRLHVNATVQLVDRERYLLDSARLVTALQDLPSAISRRDTVSIVSLVDPVRTVQQDLNLLVITDPDGKGLYEAEGSDIGSKARIGAGSSWSDTIFVREALMESSSGGKDKTAGLLQFGNDPLLAVAAPIFLNLDELAGVVITGINLRDAVSDLSSQLGAHVSVFDSQGRRLAGPHMSNSPLSTKHKDVQIVRESNPTGSVVSLYGPIELRGERVGTISIRLPEGPAFAAARSTAIRLALIILGAMLSVLVIGLLLSRTIIAQVNSLVETNRALGRGDLSARADVMSGDELGEMAKGFNQMAEQLEAGVEELETQVDQRTEELKRLLEAQKETFSTVSHEFRTPLWVIQGHAELMMDKVWKPSSRSWRRDIGQAIKSSADQLLDLVNEILTLTKLEAGRTELNLQDMSLSGLLESMKPGISALARRGELRLFWRAPSHLPTIKADSARVKEIVQNLVSNAVKYTPPGGEIRIASGEADGKVFLSVSDTGLGIPEGEGDRIFDRFYQVPGVKAQRGEASTGLGLHLTKRLVEAHGGTISYTSDVGTGSCFTVSINKALESKI